MNKQKWQKNNRSAELFISSVLWVKKKNGNKNVFPAAIGEFSISNGQFRTDGGWCIAEPSESTSVRKSCISFLCSMYIALFTPSIGRQGDLCVCMWDMMNGKPQVLAVWFHLGVLKQKSLHEQFPCLSLLLISSSTSLMCFTLTSSRDNSWLMWSPLLAIFRNSSLRLKCIKSGSRAHPDLHLYQFKMQSCKSVSSFRLSAIKTMVEQKYMFHGFTFIIL